MTGVRELLLDQLDPLERVVAAPLIEIPATRIDEDRSEVRATKTNDVICRIWSVDDSCCPFELVLHRGSGRYSWYIGLGVEISNYDEVDTPALASEAADALLGFLESTVHCELVERTADGHPVRAKYTSSKWVWDDDGSLSPFVGGLGGGFLRRKRRRLIEYSPWIDRPREP